MPLRITPPSDPELLMTRVLEHIGTSLGDVITVGRALPVATVGVPEVVTGDLSGIQGELRRWQCLVGVEEPTAAVDIVEEDGDYHVVSVNFGSLASRMNEAVAQAEQISSGTEYEIRAFEVPGLHFVALQLQGEAYDDSVFIPLIEADSVNGAIVGMRAYSADELLPRLQAAAEEGEIA